MTGHDWSLRQTQVQTYVGFTAFMTGVVVFFVGLLLASFHNYSNDIKVPIAYLIISIFGFLYSTLIYTGAAAEISNKREEHFIHSMRLGDVISEYLGVYLLIVSIPFVIGSITDDSFLRLVSISSAIIGLVVYQFSHVSMIEQHFDKSNRAISLLLSFFSLVLYISQIYNFYFVPLAFCFLLCILLVALSAIKNKRTMV